MAGCCKQIFERVINWGMGIPRRLRYSHFLLKIKDRKNDCKGIDLKKNIILGMALLSLGIAGKEVKVSATDFAAEKQIIVVYDEELLQEDVKTVLEGENSQILMNYSLQDNREMAVVEVTDETLVEDTIAEYETIPGVAYVEQDLEMELFEDDSYIPDDANVASQWWMKKLNLYKAWKKIEGFRRERVKVAVLDTGADYNHEDLVNIVNRDLSKEVIRSESGDYVLSPLKGDGWSEGQTHDVAVSHGTAVTSLLASEAGNGVGIAGSGSLGDNSGLDVFVIDVFSGKKTSLSRVVVGLNYAASQGAKVINLSLGAEITGLDSYRLLEETCHTLRAEGISIICASGNDGKEDDGEVRFVPGDFDTVMSVISVDSNNRKAVDSNYGVLKDISAPGVLLHAAKSGGTYRPVSGTSMATPLVSGIVAGMYALKPDLTCEEVEEIVYKTAVDLYEEGRDNKSGYGLIDANACMEEVLTRKIQPPKIEKLAGGEEGNVYKAKVNMAEISEDTQFRWLLYDVENKIWKELSGWGKKDSVEMEIPDEGLYWVRVEVQNRAGSADSTIYYTSSKKDVFDIKGIYAFGENGNYKAGAVYEGREDRVQFRWLLYDVKQKQWSIISDWSKGNWMSMKIPSAGDYWIRVEGKSGSSQSDSTITYHSEDTKPLKIKGIYAFEERGNYKAGAVYEGPENAEFRWLLYDLGQKQWSIISDWSKGNWMTLKIPKKGDYWIRVEGKSDTGQSDSTITYHSNGLQPLKIKGIYAFWENGNYKAGGVYEGEQEQVEFRWLLYDLGQKKWSMISDWSKGNWVVIKKLSKGDYWIRIEARQGDENANHTINYKVE